MNRESLPALIEAVVLTARSPVTPEAVSLATDREIGEVEIEEAIVALAASWEEAERGIRLEKAA